MKEGLRGITAKLERARELTDWLDAELQLFLRRDPSPYRIERRLRENEYVFVAYGEPSVPDRLAVVAGEVIHHLRSGLDHLICAMVLSAGGVITRQNQFPICISKAKMDQVSPGMLEGVPKAAKDIVRSLQPYTSTTPSDTMFFALNELDNLDKHRLLLMATTLNWGEM